MNKGIQLSFDLIELTRKGLYGTKEYVTLIKKRAEYQRYDMRLNSILNEFDKDGVCLRTFTSIQDLSIHAIYIMKVLHSDIEKGGF